MYLVSIYHANLYMLRQMPPIVPRALQGPTPTRLVRDDDTSRAVHRLSILWLSRLRALAMAP